MSLGSTADIDFMLEEAGVAVTIGAVSDFGILDQSNVVQQSQGMEYQTRVTTLLVRSGLFTLSNGVAVTADGGSYRLDEWQLEDDGKLTRLILARAT